MHHISLAINISYLHNIKNHNRYRIFVSQFIVEFLIYFFTKSLPSLHMEIWIVILYQGILSYAIIPRFKKLPDVMLDAIDV